MKNHKIFEMSVSDVYPHYVNKVEKKGQTRDDLHELQMIWHTKTLNLLTRVTNLKFKSKVSSLSPKINKPLSIQEPTFPDRACP